MFFFQADFVSNMILLVGVQPNVHQVLKIVVAAVERLPLSLILLRCASYAQHWGEKYLRVISFCWPHP
jgi:hypothetical protein